MAQSAGRYVRRMYVCMHACVCVCICVCIIFMYVCMYVCDDVCIYVFVYVYLCVHLCIYVLRMYDRYVCMSVLMYVHVCLYICMPSLRIAVKLCLWAFCSNRLEKATCRRYMHDLNPEHAGKAGHNAGFLHTYVHICIHTCIHDMWLGASLVQTCSRSHGVNAHGSDVSMCMCFLHVLYM